MANQHHTIKNQICEIEVHAHIDYYMLKDRINHTLQRLVYPKLGFICDKYSKCAMRYNIRSLEIDLGTVDLSDIVSVFVEQIPQEFEIALRDALQSLSKCEILAESSVSKAHVRSQELDIELQTVKYFLNTGTLPWWNKDNKKSLTSMLTNIATKHLTKTKQLLSSLNQKAWNRLIAQQNDYQLSFLIKNISPKLQYDTNKLYQDLQKLICSTASILPDKLRLHYWSFVITFAISRSNEKKPIILIDELISYLAFIADQTNYTGLIEQIIQRVTVLDGHSSIHPSITLWANKAKDKVHVLFQLLGEVNKAAGNISALSSKEQLLFDKILRISKNCTANPGALDKNRRLLMKALVELVKLLQETPRDIGSSASSSQRKILCKKITSLVRQVKPDLFTLPLSLHDSGSCLTDPVAGRKSVKVQERIQKSQISEDFTLRISGIDNNDAHDIFSRNSIYFDHTYYVENAGLVLYWAYLKNLFTKLKVLNKSQAKFLNDRASIRATLVLNLFVYGHTKHIPEHKLSLNKVLCGRQVNSPLPNTLKIKHIEEQESSILTSTLISHWKALGKITIEGFRKEFVQRDGSIIEREGQYILRVKKQPQDVLLNKLPWAINIIKLPWMKNSLIVEW